MPAGKPVTVSFDQPVRLVVLRDADGPRTLRFAKPRETVPLGVVASGARTEPGIVTVRSAPRTLGAAVATAPGELVPARDARADARRAAPGELLRPNGAITLTFSRPTANALGSAMPMITPDVPGHWRQLDTHTVSFRPTGLGFPLGSHVEVRLPLQVDLAQPAGAGSTTSTLTWDVQPRHDPPPPSAARPDRLPPRRLELVRRSGAAHGRRPARGRLRPAGRATSAGRTRPRPRRS